MFFSCYIISNKSWSIFKTTKHNDYKNKRPVGVLWGAIAAHTVIITFILKWPNFTGKAISQKSEVQTHRPKDIFKDTRMCFRCYQLSSSWEEKCSEYRFCAAMLRGFQLPGYSPRFFFLWSLCLIFIYRKRKETHYLRIKSLGYQLWQIILACRKLGNSADYYWDMFLTLQLWNQSSRPLSAHSEHWQVHHMGKV